MVILPLQAFGVTLQLLRLLCLFLLVFFIVLTPMEELFSGYWIIGLVDIASSLKESNVKGGTDKVLSDGELLDNR